MVKRNRESGPRGNNPPTSADKTGKTTHRTTVKRADQVKSGDLIEFRPGYILVVSGVVRRYGKVLVGDPPARRLSSVVLTARGVDHSYKPGTELVCHGETWTVTA